MKNIFDTLREKEGQLRQLEKEVEALKTAARILMDDKGEAATRTAAAGLSQPQMIRRVLLDEGKPMHVSEITKAIKKTFDKKIKTTHLAALIYRYKTRGKLFYKVDGKPNTFGLLEWQVHQMAASPPQERGRAVS